MISTQQIQALAGGLDNVFGSVALGFLGKLADAKLPIVGTSLNDAIQGGESALAKLSDLQQKISAALGALQDGLDHPAQAIADKLNQALAQAGFDKTVTITTNASNALTVTFANDATSSFSTALASDLGLGFASLETTGTAKVDLDFHVGVSATVTTDGTFTTSTPGGGPAASVTLDASAPQFSGDAKLGYLNFSAVDEGSSLHSTFALDVQGNASLTASATAKVGLEADLQNADFPSISADLSATWNFGGAPTLSFDHVKIDFGSFVTDFIDPILKRLDPILEPLHELAKIIETDLTPLDKYASVLDVSGASDASGNDIGDGKVTLVDLLKLADIAAGRHDNFTGLAKFADFVTEITDWAAFLQNKSFGADQYDLGSFTVDPATLAISATSGVADFTAFIDGLSGGSYGLVDPTSGDTAAGIVSQIVANADFAFPILTDQMQAFRLLLGETATLFTFDIGAQFGIGSFDADGTPHTVPIATFPVFPIPYIQVVLSGALQAAARFVGGYDTHGLQEFAQSGYQAFADLANGFYLTGGQTMLQLEAAIEGVLGIGIPGATIEGGANITGELDLTLAHTLYLDELPADFAQLFTTSGKITAAFTGDVNIGGWIPFSYNSPRITVANFSGGVPGLSGSTAAIMSPGGGTAGGSSSSGPTTAYTVTDANFDSVVAAINAAAQNGDADFFKITIAAGSSVTIDENFPGFSVPDGVVVQIVDNGTLVYDSASDVTLGTPIGGSGSIDAKGTGTLKLASSNSFAGHLKIESGTVELGSSGAEGNGEIEFAPNAHATLSVDPGASPTQKIFGFDSTDTIHLSGLSLTYANRDDDNVVTLSDGNGITDTLGIDPAQDLTGLAQKPNPGGGTDVYLLKLQYDVSSTAQFDDALASIDVGGANSLPGAPYKSQVVSGATVSLDATYPGVNLPDMATLKIIDNGTFDFDKSGAYTFVQAIGGSGGIGIDAGARVALTGDNSYSGGTVLNGGTLELGSATAAGTGAIAFTPGSKSTLKIDSGDVPANVIKGFVSGDVIDLIGVSATIASTDSNHVLSLQDASQHTLATLNIDPAQDFSGQAFVAESDGAGGTKLRLVRTVFDVANTGDFNADSASISVGGDDSAPGLVYKFNIRSGAHIDTGSGFLGINLPDTSTLGIVNLGTIELDTGATADITATIGGTGNIDVKGTGTLELAKDNQFLGHSTIEAGTLKLDTALAASTGRIDFSTGSQGTLELAAGVTVANTIGGMLPGETIRLDGVATKSAVLDPATNVLSVFKSDGNGGTTLVTTLQLDPTVDYEDYSFRTRADKAHPGSSVVQVIKTTFHVSSTADWNLAVKTMDFNGASAGNDADYPEGWEDTPFKIILDADFTLTGDLEAINLTHGSQVTIVGNNHTIDGANRYSGIFDYAGKVIGNDFSIVNAHAQGGDGGAGGTGGGAGAGLGGGLFVAKGGDVTLKNVSFTHDTATGGGGGDAGSTFTVTSNDGHGNYSSTTYISQGGAGGGIGGNGGATGGGGGGIGNGADGANGTPTGATTSSGSYYGLPGILPQKPGETYYDQLSSAVASNSGGGSVGFAGGAEVPEESGSIYGTSFYNLSGRFGGGGGAGLLSDSYFDINLNHFVSSTFNAAGSGGLGGGGGGGTGGEGNASGGDGGFGGGAGGALGATYSYYASGQSYTGASRPGTAGFGGGAGGAGENASVTAGGVTANSLSGGGGGGGAGLGGGVFVQSGGKLTIDNGGVSQGAVALRVMTVLPARPSARAFSSKERATRRCRPTPAKLSRSLMRSPTRSGRSRPTMAAT